MPKSGRETRHRLLDSACGILSEESLSNLSVERICEQAGVSRRTFFCHFSSKDHLLAEVVDHLRPTFLDHYRSWTGSCGPSASLEERLLRLFECITNLVSDRTWKGSLFVRVSAELGNMPGHPVHAVVAAAHRDMEDWFTTELRSGGYSEPASIARQLVVMITGLLLLQLVTRSEAYGRDIANSLTRFLSTCDRLTVRGLVAVHEPRNDLGHKPRSPFDSTMGIVSCP